MQRLTVSGTVRLLLGIAFVFSVSACAHSPGSYNPVIPLKDGVLSQYTSVIIEASNRNEVPLTANDRDRIVNKIVRKVQVTNRFKEINVSTAAPSRLKVNVEVTNYDEGNAFLRFMLAGLGQIHIDGQVTLIDQD
jgi:hypothetical protein